MDGSSYHQSWNDLCFAVLQVPLLVRTCVSARVHAHAQLYVGAHFCDTYSILYIFSILFWPITLLLNGVVEEMVVSVWL
jgi:hypothetical protein